MTTSPTPAIDFSPSLGAPTDWSGKDGPEFRFWRTDVLEVLVAAESVSDGQLRAAYRRRAIGQTPVLIVAPVADSMGMARTVGPLSPQGPPRYVAQHALEQAVVGTQQRSRRTAAAYLESELGRLDGADVPGITFNGLLTAHTMKRIRQVGDDHLGLVASSERVSVSTSWRDNFTAVGYDLRQERDFWRLEVAGRTVALLQPHNDETFLGAEGKTITLPAGKLISDCLISGVDWGIMASNHRWRLYRVEHPTGSAVANYFEVDLRYLPFKEAAILGVFAPFALSSHESRVSRLTTWMQEAADNGAEIKVGIERQLRETALHQIAQGLGKYVQAEEGADLKDPEVREAIQSASFSLLFRILFVQFAEGARYLPLHVPEYRSRSITGLCAEALRLEGRTQGNGSSRTLWDSLQTLFGMIRGGDTARSVAAYNGSLFAAIGFPGVELLERASIEDRFLAPALRSIGYYDDGPDDSQIDYSELGVSHLGSIYEGLISLRLSWTGENLTYYKKGDTERYQPVRSDSDTIAVFANELFFQSKTGGRKAGGVYYTRQELVRHILNHSLVPALKHHLEEIESLIDANRTDEAAERLFDFRIVDPAMGSGHFLTDALNIMADRYAQSPAMGLQAVQKQLADLKSEEMVSRTAIRDEDLLRRLIVKRCIFGVDLSEMAVEVANISLWLASFVEGLSLAFLGSNLKQGDALVGVASWDVLAGLGPQFSHQDTEGIPDSPLRLAIMEASALQKELSEITDRDPSEVNKSAKLANESNTVVSGLKTCLNLWTAQSFVTAIEAKRKKSASQLGKQVEIKAGPLDVLSRHESVDRLIHGDEPSDVNEIAAVLQATEIAKEWNFFHWPVEFPEIFARENPGFDAVVGNPPWNELTIEQLAFYALHEPGLRGLRGNQAGARQQERIIELDDEFPNLRPEFDKQKAGLKTLRAFFVPGNGYVAQGVGDPDLYKFFCERYRHLARERGYIGVVLPRNTFLAAGSRGFRQWLYESTTVTRQDVILNSRSWAFPIHPQFTITLLTARVEKPNKNTSFIGTGPSDSVDAFAAAISSSGVEVGLPTLARWTSVSGHEHSTWEVPLLPSRSAVRVLDKIRRGPRFEDGYPGFFKAFPVRELDETNDKRFFPPSRTEGISVWKGASFDQYEPYGTDIKGFADEIELIAYLQRKRTSPQGAFRRKGLHAGSLQDSNTHPFYLERIVFRDVTRSTDSRTIRACLIPPRVAIGNTGPYLAPVISTIESTALMLGLLNSLPMDWQARRYVETHMNFFVLNLLALPPLERLDVSEISRLAAELSCKDERYAEFARESKIEIRSLTRSEMDAKRSRIDAHVAIAFGLESDDLEVVFDDFQDTAASVSSEYRELVREEFARLGRSTN